MRRVATVLAIALSPTTAHARPQGFYARAAAPIWDRMRTVRVDPGGYLHTRFIVRSPDGRTAVVARFDEAGREGDGVTTLTIHREMVDGTIAVGPGVGSELLWSPDPRVFAVTTSDGGANGPYRTLVVARAGRQWIATDLTPAIHRAFGHPVRCGWPEPPNVGAVRWEAGGRQLVVAAEIVHHSNCDSFGTFRTYTVDRRTGRVVATHDQIAARRLYRASLGLELRAAPDRCVRRPRSCWVITNHERGGTR